VPKDGGAVSSPGQLLCAKAKDTEDKKPKPVREESLSSKEFFKNNDFSYIDEIVDPDRKKRDGPKGYPPSSIFMALLLMYLRSMESILDLVRFLKTNPEWLVTLNLRRKVKGEVGLTMLAYDMRRAINILGTKALMASLASTV
jgi:hypothetical protein